MSAVTVLFDIDGTLLSFRSLGRKAMELAIEEIWGIPDALEGFSFAGATDGAIAEKIAPGRERAPMWERYLRHLDDLTAEREDLIPLEGAGALLDALHSAGARIGLLTGNMRRAAELKLRCARLLGRFDFTLSAFAEDGIPRERLAQAARGRCGPGALAIVGDSVADIRCARHVGARVLAVATGPQTPSQLAAEKPDRLEADLTSTASLAAWLLSPL